MQSPMLKLAEKTYNLCRRDFGIFVPFLQKASDPIQQLFVDKIREYKSKSAGGKLVEPSPEMEKEMKNDRERVVRQFGGKSAEDFSKFPTFNFKDPAIENTDFYDKSAK